MGIHKFDDNGKLVGEYRFVGLLTSQAYQLTVQQIPLLREKANKIMKMAELPRDGHAHHKLMHVINTLPRDDLFQAGVEELYPIVSGISQLQDKRVCACSAASIIISALSHAWSTSHVISSTLSSVSKYKTF
ncbi:hypothetical protein Psyaliredsea_17200 [Psychrobacter alimentarius]